MPPPEDTVKKQSFLTGAMVLAAGSFASRVLGAVYRIFLPHIMGGGQQGIRGIGFFQMAYPVYQVLLSLSFVGIPLSISKLVSARISDGDRDGAWRIHMTSLWMLVCAGGVISVGMFVGADYYANHVIQQPDARYSIQALAPAVFFVSLLGAYRGFFQGLQNMTPHAISEVVEQLVRVVTMFVLAALLLDFGIEFAAAGAAFGAVTGAAVGLIYLVWVFRSRRTAIERTLAGERDRSLSGPLDAGDVSEDPAAAPDPEAPTAPTESTAAVLKRILRLAVPIALTGLMLPLMNLIDATVVPIRLAAAGIDSETVTLFFGDLAGLAFPLTNIPAVFTGALAVSLVPAVSEALASARHDVIRRNTAAALRITIILTLPAAVGLYLLAEAIPDMIWQRPEAGLPLAVLAFVALFLPIQQVTSGILQGLGRPEIPMRNLFVGGSFKLGITWYLTALPGFGIVGAAWGSTIGFALASGLNVWSVYRHTGHVGQLVDTVLKPLAAVVVMGAVVEVVFAGTSMLTEVVMWPTLAAVAAGAAGYLVAIVAVGGIRSSDLKLLPRFGSRLARLIDRMPTLRI